MYVVLLKFIHPPASSGWSENRQRGVACGSRMRKPNYVRTKTCVGNGSHKVPVCICKGSPILFNSISESIGMRQVNHESPDTPYIVHIYRQFQWWMLFNFSVVVVALRLRSISRAGAKGNINAKLSGCLRKVCKQRRSYMKRLNRAQKRTLFNVWFRAQCMRMHLCM